ncbi:tetratricopeptide repeat protein [Solihabitans fulvus]|uniref:Tetratricopeptide repeat protein n=1 Tax=Solihabitans fulvus TaxID=1892852 RepID=A0A5B2XEI2_9PSEU|nr:FxSxx-COOH system tetratricopeptide repeat protein [Solihabitans fulvus]KAA2261763.1 tetratricopeptide repeat protein [Solihabitans fulvus]
MIDRFVDAIRAVDPDVTSEELADVCWLATHMGAAAREPWPTRTTQATRPIPVDRDAPRADPTPHTPPERTDEPAPGSSPDRGPAEPAATDQDLAAALRPPSRRLLGDDRGVQTRSPAMPAVPDTLAICRALRPLGRRVPSPTSTHLDEDATAQWIADTDLWIPATLPSSDRWLDVALVADHSASMEVWRPTVAELRTLLEQTGAFRDVRLWHLDGDLCHDERLSVSSESVQASSWRDPRELIDPTGRRLILVASDCVGQAWSTGAVAETLRAWAKAGPIAIVQMLPQRLWTDCAPEFVPVRLHSVAPGVPNSRLGVASRHGDGDLTGVGVPIPVLELEDRWLKRWASLVAGTSGGWVNGTAVFTNQLAALTVQGDHAAQELASQPTPREQLHRFRARASPEAYRLAICLAGAPLSLPVMRLVQGAMLPSSRPSHLAEVFLSDLLHRLDTDGTGYKPRPDDVEYDFQPGIRDELLTELTRQDALQVLSRVSNFVTARLGSPLDFRALLTTDQLPDLPDLSPPFARVAYQVLHSLGGRYAEAAERLNRLSEIGRVARQVTQPTTSDPSSFDPDAPSRSQGADLTRTVPPIATERDRREEMPPAIMRGIPSRNPHFTGRKDILARLRSMLVNSTKQTALLPHALHGLGGVGKTQLAIEYVYRYASAYDLIWWVPAEDQTLIRTSLAALGSAMGLPESTDLSRTVDAVLDTLRTGQRYPRWLLVYDNANRPADLQPYLPYPTGHVLITSRNSSWSDVASTVEVDVFNRQESVALLRQRSEDINAADADRLADRLGDLPLALEQAAAWQAETGMQVDEYLELFDDQLEQLTENPPSNYPDTVGATYRVAFERLQEQAPAAAQLLELCAFFGAEPISVVLLWEGRYADLPSPLDETLRDRIRLRRAMREIVRFALARVDAAADRISVHRLVQAVLRARLTPEERDVTRRHAQQILALANPSQPDSAQNWPRHAELSPQILPTGMLQAEERDSRIVVLDQIRYRRQSGDYESARELGQLAVDTWTDLWGEDDELTLIAARHLADAMRALGENQQARELQRDTLAKLREVFGDDHEHTLDTADGVALDLRINGEFDAAKALDEDNLARARRVFEENEPFPLRATNNVAVDLRWLGDFTEARRVDTDLVQRMRLQYGERDRRTQQTVSNLAHDLYGLGEYAEALQTQERTLSIQREILGINHSEVLIETRILVMALRKTGQHARARDVAEELIRTLQRRFGLRHEYTLASMLSYANALSDTGDLDAAREVGEDTLARYRDVFGPNHAVTLACAANLAIVLRRQGDLNAALELNQATLDTFRQQLGADHPFTLCCAANTSSDLAALHRHPEARELSDDTLQRSRVVRGDDHPYTLACALNSALDHQSTGDAELAEPLLRQVVADFGRRLGDGHPETVAASARRRADCDIEPPRT